MAFPRRYLQEGEDLVVEVRPHWVYFARPGSGLGLSLLASVASALNLSGTVREVMVGVTLVGLLTCLGWAGVRYARWSTTSLTLTDRRLILRRGLRTARSRQLLLDELGEVTVDRTWWERLLGGGYLHLESAGAPGHLEVFGPVLRPGELAELIGRQAAGSAGGGGRSQERAEPSPPAPAEGSEPSPLDHLERLEDMRRRGIISRAEFEVKKAQLLDRL